MTFLKLFEEGKKNAEGNCVYVMANVESRLELSLAPSFQLSTLASNLGANVESSEKLIIRVEFLLVS